MNDYDDYDSPWKDALEHYFPEFMAFFFPTAAAQIDWRQGFVFLDKELREVARDAELGKRYVDKLVRVTRLGGEEDWLYIHVEVQGYPEAEFPQRMFVYNYRLYDRYGRPVASFAVLADDAPNWQPRQYSHEILGCSHTFKFPVAKLTEYSEQCETLLENPNPFALITVAHRLTQQSKGDDQGRYQAKRTLVRLLYQRGWDKQRVIDMFAVLDWMMRLPEDLNLLIWQEIEQLEEQAHMRYVTSVERFGLKKGIEQGIEQGIERGIQQGESKLIKRLLERRFGALPAWVLDKLAKAAAAELERWGDEILTAPTLEAVFRETALNG